MGKGRIDMLRGTLDMLVLRILAVAPSHGYAVAKGIQASTDDALQVEEGSLYPALYRMERKGWIEAEWGVTDTGRRAKFYRLTADGRRSLAAEQEAWGQFSAAVEKVLERN